MCAESVCSIYLLPLVARCVETIEVCICRIFVFMSVVVTVCGRVCCVATVVEDSVFFRIGVLKYVVCLCKGCDGWCVFCLYCEAWSCRCSCMGSMSVSSYIMCILVSCVHPMTVLNTAFCMTCSMYIKQKKIKSQRVNLFQK